MIPEEFDNISAQIFGPQDSTRLDKMRGFLIDYQTTNPGHPKNANQRMRCYSSEQVSGNVMTRSTPRAELPDIARTGAPGEPTPRWIAWNDSQTAMLVAHRKRYLHYLGSLAKFKMLRTPLPKSKTR